MKVRDIPSIPGAKANDRGQVKWPDGTAPCPNGGTRKYTCKWINGVVRRASKTARHSYRGVMYRGKNYKIHRLVCEAFHGPPPFDRAVVIHMNEDSMDNRPSNLKWGTQKENLNMPGFIEYCRSRTGENSPTVKGKMAKKARKKNT